MTVTLSEDKKTLTIKAGTTLTDYPSTLTATRDISITINPSKLPVNYYYPMDWCLFNGQPTLTSNEYLQNQNINSTIRFDYLEDLEDAFDYEEKKLNNMGLYLGSMLVWDNTNPDNDYDNYTLSFVDGFAKTYYSSYIADGINIDLKDGTFSLTEDSDVIQQTTKYISNIQIGDETYYIKSELDGQWVFKKQSIFADATFTAGAVVEYSLADYLPKDNNLYEVIFSCYGRTGNTSGNACDSEIRSSVMENIRLGRAATRTSSSAIYSGTGTLIIGADRVLTYSNSNGNGTSGNCGLSAIAYRKVR